MTTLSDFGRTFGSGLGSPVFLLQACALRKDALVAHELVALADRVADQRRKADLRRPDASGRRSKVSYVPSESERIDLK